MVSFGKDLIAEKNKRERLKNSIIKYWNVNYCDPKLEQEEEKKQAVQSVLERLEQEAAEDEAKKQAVIEQAYREAELKRNAYNATTGSYSGIYGQGEVDTVTKNQVEMILNEKNDALKTIIEKKG